MAKYAFTGWGPETGPDGELVRPFDEREFEDQPTWGRWALVSPPESPESDSPPPGTDPPVTPPPASPADGPEPPVTGSQPSGGM